MLYDRRNAYAETSDAVLFREGRRLARPATAPPLFHAYETSMNPLSPNSFASEHICTVEMLRRRTEPSLARTPLRGTDARLPAFSNWRATEIIYENAEFCLRRRRSDCIVLRLAGFCPNRAGSDPAAGNVSAGQRSLWLASQSATAFLARGKTDDTGIECAVRSRRGPATCSSER